MRSFRLQLGLGLSRGYNGFSPLQLDGLQLWLDPYDTSTLFQDASGTVPVTSPGDPVRLMLDKSGNGNDLTAPSDAARPTYQASGSLRWLEFDGVDDALATSGLIPFSTAIFNCTAFRAAAFPVTFPRLIVNRGGASSTADRQPMLFLNSGNVDEVRFRFGDGSLAAEVPESSVINLDIVASAQIDGANRSTDINGVSASASGNVLTDDATGAFMVSDAPGSPYQGRFYGTVQANSVPSESQIADTRRWFSQRSGGVA